MFKCYLSYDFICENMFYKPSLTKSFDFLFQNVFLLPSTYFESPNVGLTTVEPISFQSQKKMIILKVFS